MHSLHFAESGNCTRHSDPCPIHHPRTIPDCAADSRPVASPLHLQSTYHALHFGDSPPGYINNKDYVLSQYACGSMHRSWPAPARRRLTILMPVATATMDISFLIGSRISRTAQPYSPITLLIRVSLYIPRIFASIDLATH